MMSLRFSLLRVCLFLPFPLFSLASPSLTWNEGSLSSCFLRLLLPLPTQVTVCVIREDCINQHAKKGKIASNQNANKGKIVSIQNTKNLAYNHVYSESFIFCKYNCYLILGSSCTVQSHYIFSKLQVVYLNTVLHQWRVRTFFIQIVVKFIW